MTFHSAKGLHSVSALLCAWGLFITPAAQAATATGSVTNIHVELIDLDLNDGITPSVTFNSADAFLGSLSMVGGNPEWTSTRLFGSVGAALGPFATQIGRVSLSSQLLAGNLFVGQGPGATAWAIVDEANAGAWAFGNALATSLTLTPNTRLQLTADAAASTSGDPGTTAYGYGSLQINNSYAAVRAYTETNGSWGAPSPATVMVYMDNLTNASADGYAIITASAYVTTAVPEPQTFALMMAGLAAVAATTWRRRQH